MPFTSALARFSHMRALLLLACTACTPSLNWRDVRAGAGEQAAEVKLQMPCKPTRNSRKVILSNEKTEAAVNFTLTGCKAADMSFTLGAADMSQPERAAPALAWLAQKLATNIQAPPSSGVPFSPKGADSGAKHQRLKLQGQLPDGSKVEEQVALFNQGARVYQATVMAPAGLLSSEAAEAFFTSIELHQ
jgi:hypothetical protein